jgi:hypothetical protein
VAEGEAYTIRDIVRSQERGARSEEKSRKQEAGSRKREYGNTANNSG